MIGEKESSWWGGALACSRSLDNRTRGSEITPTANVASLVGLHSNENLQIKDSNKKGVQITRTFYSLGYVKHRLLLSS
jgi:hypothetical protein